MIQFTAMTMEVGYPESRNPIHLVCKIDVDGAGNRMSISTPRPPRPRIVYPDSDGEPMAENTLQFQWIVTIKEGLE